ncbi:MAG: ECF transporter S component, partial [Ruminiclostridium sp.]|nr:ECF transporter S component [Ruminiclostridium sp.]
MQTQTKKITVIAMLSAIAYLVMVVGRIPIVLFLKYDPKDVIITIGGFLFGPLTAFTMSALVSSVEMLTVSTTGFIGLLMDIISSCSFACTAAIIYKKKHNYKGAILGLIAGWLVTTATMLLWNYLITPIYLGYPREAVVELLIPAFLPFNLLKGGLNASIAMLIYKP